MRDSYPTECPFCGGHLDDPELQGPHLDDTILSAWAIRVWDIAEESWDVRVPHISKYGDRHYVMEGETFVTKADARLAAAEEMAKQLGNRCPKRPDV